MGRIYTVVMASVSITNANGDVDWFAFTPADDQPIKLRGFQLAQTSVLGDANEADARFRVLRLDTSLGGSSGGTTPTPIPMDSADAASGFTAHANDTTVATATNTKVLHEFGWNLRNSPYEFWYPDVAFCPKAKQGQLLVVRQESTLAVTTTCLATAWVEEE